MSDFFQDFKKQNKGNFTKNIAVIATSFVFALSVNAFLFGTNTGNRLQSSVRNFSAPTPLSAKNIYLESAGTGSNIVLLKSGTAMSNVSELNLSLLFDPKNMDIKNIFGDNSNISVTKNSNIPGVISATIQFATPVNFNAGDKIVDIVYAKSTTANTVVNLAETRFKSGNKEFDLTNTPLDL